MSRCGQKQRPEQTQEFVACERDEVGFIGVAAAFEGDGEEGVGDQGHRAPAVPGVPAGDLPLSRAQVSLAAWKSSSTRHLRHTSDTSLASVTDVGEKQR